jgi:PAS domain S-box-containing protein
MLLLLAVLLAVNLGTALMLAWSTSRLLDTYEIRAALTASAVSAVVGSYLSNSLDKEQMNRRLASIRAMGGYMRIEVYHHKGELIADAGIGRQFSATLVDSARILIGDALEGRRSISRVNAREGDIRLRVELPTSGSPPFAVLLVEPAAPYDSIVRTTRLETVIRTFAVIVVLAAALFLVRDTMRPFRRIRERASNLPDLDHDAFTTKSSDPLFVAEAFDVVADSLEAKHKALLEAHAVLKARAGELEEFASLILRSMPSGLIGVDDRGVITRFNETAEQVLGIAASDALSCPVEETLSDFADLVDSMRDALEKGTELRRQMFQLDTPTGRRVIGASVNAVLDRRGERVGAVAIFTDLTEVTRLREQEHMAIYGEAAAGLAHEVRNALGAVLSDARLVSLETSSEKRASEALERIVWETRNLNTLIDRLLQLGQEISPERKAVDIRELVEEVWRKLTQRESMTAVLLAIDGGAIVLGDPHLLRVAVENLLSNSISAVGSTDRDGLITAKIVPGDNAVTLEIKDNGPGFPDAVVHDLFKPFVTGRAGGVGLGLALVRKIVTAHDGLIEANNPAEGGSLVVVRLPAGGN